MELETRGGLGAEPAQGVHREDLLGRGGGLNAIEKGETVLLNSLTQRAKKKKSDSAADVENHRTCFRERPFLQTKVWQKDGARL